MSKAALSARHGARDSFSQLSFRVSTALARPHASINQVVRILQESGRLAWVSLQVLTYVEPERWEFAWPAEHENEVLLRADALTDRVSVAIDGAVPAEDADQAQLLLALTSQQIAQFVHRNLLAEQNAALFDDLRIMSEQVALAKFVERAKSLIISRRGFSAHEAEEWLIGASIRFDKPLLNVAQEIVTAFKTPGFAA
jgi:hypothetical protein